MATRQNLLSPEELSALSEGLKDGSLETDTGFNTGVRVRKHDLASEDSSLGVNVSSIDMINERFIRLFRLGLLEVLRTSPRVNPSRTQLKKFGDYLRNLHPPCSVNVVKVTPLRGSSMVLLDPNVIASYTELAKVTSEYADVSAALAQAEEAWLELEGEVAR